MVMIMLPTPPIGTSGYGRDLYSLVEQELERTRQEKEKLERQRLEHEMASEIERARQEQQRLER